ncbi:unnamed protein product [Sphagnum compactum]
MKLILREGIVCILENGEEDLQFSLFAEKIQADCEAVWHAGYRHISKLHLNKCLVVFLHTCACGWWRRRLKYPFDYENASVSFFQFPNCKGLLPLLAMPSCNGEDSLGGSAWSLIHLGNAEYYQTLVGLTQSGFFTKWSFLSPCNFVVVYLKEFTPGFLHTKEDAKPGIKVAATET